MRGIFMAGMLAAVTTQVQAAPCVKNASEPTQLSIAGGAVKFCLGQGNQRACYTVALDSGALGTIAAPKGETQRFAPTSPQPKIEVGDASVSVCNADGSACRTLKPKGEVDPGLGITAAVNEAGTLAALGYLANRPQVELFDLTNGKRLGKLAAGSKKLMCLELSFVGDSLYVGEAECGSETTSAWLATRMGKKVAAVGGNPAFKPSGDTVHVEKNVWAFGSAAGDAVVLQDVKTGKVSKRIAIGPASDEASAALLGDGKRLVVVFDGSRAGDVAIVDLATDKVTTHAAARCK